ncbi:MAG: ZIP family metal transporter, partial [Clostridia bacterium]|nr:ZIP family metal transporter [Clostridia bacterium]
MADALLWASAGTGFTFLMTTLGAAMVFLFHKEMSGNIQKVFLGFAAGVMIAASVWSLLIPAIAEAEANGQVGWFPAAGGFVLGIVFLYGLDLLIPHLHPATNEREGPTSSMKRTSLLVTAVTLHNIPEGISVSVPIFYATGNRKKAFAYSFLSGFSEPLGALVGFGLLFAFF